MKELVKYKILQNIIFFLNVFIALMIISGSWLLIQTEFGKTALIFGFVMLAASAMLKIVQQW